MHEAEQIIFHPPLPSGKLSRYKAAKLRCTVTNIETEPKMRALDVEKTLLQQLNDLCQDDEHIVLR